MKRTDGHPARRPAYLDGVPEGLTGAEADAARALASEGFCVLDLGDEATLALCDDAVRQVARYHRDGNRVQDAWRTCPAVRALACDVRVRRFLDLAYGRPSFPFQTLSFERGSRQGLHSDATHFYSDPPGFVAGVWFALEDAREDAGPLTYVPGSHRWPTLTPRALGITADRPTPTDYARANEAAIRTLVEAHDVRARQALLRKGQAGVWAADLVHGGAPVARKGATRRSLVVHNYFGGCVYTTPMTSGQQRTLRLPQDVRSGTLRWPRGERPAVKTIVDGYLRRLTRKVHVYEA